MTAEALHSPLAPRHAREHDRPLKIAFSALLRLLALWAVLSGVLALVTGRVLGLRARRVLRPALWGSGQACVGVAAALAALTTAFSVTDGDALGAAVLLFTLTCGFLTRWDERP
ncbi:hypothetical protein [Actinacidiphila glaucinigra]|uniref:hypothetical protein n=1 Tax=Actinacidiphila glaucinigra TaxID=235986 RepID=UPI0029B74014|nr:hypothetical protein [Streptomyces sp. PA03-3a]